MESKMTRDELLAFHAQIAQKAVELMKAKNHDYSGGADKSNPFLNFSRVESMGITDTKTGFLVRMTDKFSRLATFVTNGTYKTKDEALEDTIVDLINYSVLFLAYAQSEKDYYKE